MENKYTKLSDLVNDTFTIQKVWGYQFKFWDEDAKRMVTSDTWVQGYRKVYQVDTDKGKLDLSANQFANMLESVSKGGVADINGRTFAVKSNGKTGMDIRYYINVSQTNVEPAKTHETYKDDNQVDLSDIPF